MADQARVEVHGYAQLASGSAGLFRRIPTNAEARFRTVADQVAAPARGRVPHRSGQLAGSVSVAAEPDGASVGIGAGAAGAYAGWIEFGGTRGRPYVGSGRYLFPTAEGAEPLLHAQGELAAREEIGRTLWPTPRP
jgi:phage gpG-like protein